MEIMAVLLRMGWALRVAFFRGPDGELIELLKENAAMVMEL